MLKEFLWHTMCCHESQEGETQVFCFLVEFDPAGYIQAKTKPAKLPACEPGYLLFEGFSCRESDIGFTSADGRAPSDLLI